MQPLSYTITGERARHHLAMTKTWWFFNRCHGNWFTIYRWLTSILSFLRYVLGVASLKCIRARILTQS